jgi:hypothetical protein
VSDRRLTSVTSSSTSGFRTGFTDPKIISNCCAERVIRAEGARRSHVHGFHQERSTSVVNTVLLLLFMDDFVAQGLFWLLFSDLRMTFSFSRASS